MKPKRRKVKLYYLHQLGTVDVYETISDNYLYRIDKYGALQYFSSFNGVWNDVMDLGLYENELIFTKYKRT